MISYREFVKKKKNPKIQKGNKTTWAAARHTTAEEHIK